MSFPIHLTTQLNTIVISPQNLEVTKSYPIKKHIRIDYILISKGFLVAGESPVLPLQTHISWLNYVKL